MNMAMANDMADAPITEDTIAVGSGGNDGEEEDQGDDQEGALLLRTLLL
jgi:hypothetical protein